MECIPCEVIHLCDGDNQLTPHQVTHISPPFLCKHPFTILTLLQWAADYPDYECCIRVHVCPATTTTAYIQVGVIPLGKADLEDQAGGCEAKSALPTILVPMVKENGSAVTGLEAPWTPLEDQASSTAAVVKSFFFMSGTDELSVPPDTNSVAKSVRSILASLKRPVTCRTVKEWEADWNKEGWTDRAQDVVWPELVVEETAAPGQ